jgi:hypothetical protein
MINKIRSVLSHFWSYVSFLDLERHEMYHD